MSVRKDKVSSSLKAVEECLAELESADENIVREALLAGKDLSNISGMFFIRWASYSCAVYCVSVQVNEELTEAHRSAVLECIQNADKLTDLHNQILACDQVFEVLCIALWTAWLVPQLEMLLITVMFPPAVGEDVARIPRRPWHNQRGHEAATGSVGVDQSGKYPTGSSIPFVDSFVPNDLQRSMNRSRSWRTARKSAASWVSSLTTSLCLKTWSSTRTSPRYSRIDLYKTCALES